MNQTSLKDKTYAAIMKHFVANGQAPHHTQIAKELGISPAEGQKAIRNLFSTTGFAGWLFPKTDAIVSFAPFNNLPTHYRLTIDGQQKWFGQWAFESLAVCWLFPGKTVQIDSICLDCGQPIQVKVKDGKILSQDPESTIGHVSVPIGRWAFNVPYAWSTMNFFRSEEHLFNWKGFSSRKQGGIIATESLMWLFSGPYFTRRLDQDYMSHYGDYMEQMLAALGQLKNAGSFWQVGPLEKAGFALGRKMGII